MNNFTIKTKHLLANFIIRAYRINKIILGILVNAFITASSFVITSNLLNIDYDTYLLFVILFLRTIYSFIFFNDYKLSWSKASVKTAFLKLFINTFCFITYFLLIYFFYEINISFLILEFSNYIVLMTFSIYTYKYYKSNVFKNKKNKIIIYGAGEAGLSVRKELSSTNEILYFLDDDQRLYFRAIDGLPIISPEKMLSIEKDNLIDYSLVIAIPSAKNIKIISIYNKFKSHFKDIKILPPLSMIYHDKPFVSQLKKISILDLLARNPKDLDKNLILNFIKSKTVLITGSSGTIGGELLNLCLANGVKKIIAIDHNEFGQYNLLEKNHKNVEVYVVSVLNEKILSDIFKTHKPEIVIHAAAYKHVYLSEISSSSAILNNIQGTKNVLDISIKHNIDKFVLISTDKAVKPTNVMGATKSIAELYCQNIVNHNTDVVCVRFGNVLGSSGSVIPKFKKQIEKDQDITVTHKNITRYFMLVNEACMLVLQAAAIGKNGEILILDMGSPIKIAGLAQKMIDLSGKEYLKIKYTGLRKGEKLYEELLFNKSDKKTKYDSITVAKKREYDINILNNDIDILLSKNSKGKVDFIKKIIPDFQHLRDN